MCDKLTNIKKIIAALKFVLGTSFSSSFSPSLLLLSFFFPFSFLLLSSFLLFSFLFPKNLKVDICVCVWKNKNWKSMFEERYLHGIISLWLDFLQSTNTKSIHCFSQFSTYHFEWFMKTLGIIGTYIKTNLIV